MTTAALTGPIEPGLHFSWEEAWRSPKHPELEPENRAALFADPALVDAVRHVARDLVEPVRRRFGVVLVHSWFRCPALNAAVNGSRTSQHMRGEAVDFSCPGVTFAELATWIQQSGIRFGQLLVEPLGTPVDSWIHLSLGYPWRDAAKCAQVRF